MSDSITIARPYAKAIFEYAFESGKLKVWSELLFGLSQVIMNNEAHAFISNPAVTPNQQIALLTETVEKIAGAESDSVKNLITVLAHNKRLLIIPEIYTLFEALRAEQEKTVVVQVTSYSSLSDEQQERMVNSLSKRLQRQVTLKVTIDTSLLGGAVIRAGDLVIDGSVRASLTKLGADLAAA